jgi:DNA-directed RNA polymerase II subunit RPB3
MFSNILHNKKLNRISFDIVNIDVGIVNALRRTILNDIETVAVSFDPYNSEENDTHFIANTSALHNEFISHRLSMIPINLTLPQIDSFVSENVSFVIQKKNEINETILVTTDDIKVQGEAHYKSTDLFPHDSITKEPILITKLRPNLFNKQLGEEIHVEFTARKGTGSKNACWSPTSLCSYSFNTDPKKVDEELKKRLDGRPDDEHEKIKHTFETLDKYRYYIVNDYNEPSSFHFTLESVYQAIPPEQLFAKGIAILWKKVDSVKEHLSDCEFIPNGNMHTIVLENENHTLGNLLQTFIYTNYVHTTGTVTYVGYNVPHPLEKIVHIRVVFKGQMDIIVFFEQCLQALSKRLRSIHDEWENAIKKTNGQTPKPVKTTKRAKPVSKDKKVVS